MAKPLWRTLKCITCQAKVPSFIVINWRFDKDRSFHIIAVCRFCLTRVEVEHTRDEQLADAREDYVRWLGNQADPMSKDMLIWENQMTDDREEE